MTEPNSAIVGEPLRRLRKDRSGKTSPTSRLWVLLILAGTAFWGARCSAKPPAPPPHVADCDAFETAVKFIPGLPEWAPRNKNGYLRDLGQYWCVEASPRWSQGREWADQLLQHRLFKTPSKPLVPVKREHRAAIDAFTGSAERLLCPDWRTTPYETPSLAEIAKHAVVIQCK